MQIRLEDDPQIKAELAAIGRQAPFALSLGINNTGLRAQRAARGEIARSFALRGTGTFFDRGVVFKRGTKAQPSAQLSIGVEGGWPGTATKRASAMLARHEEGGTRSSTQTVNAGGSQVPAGFFLPGPGLRTRGSNPPRALYPSAIGATLRRQVSGTQAYASSTKGRGRNRAAYYVVPNVGIFERKGGGLGSRSRPIWFFSRRVRTAPLTGFRAMADDTIDDVWTIEIRRAIAQALETAR
jgi:hypothetical protein